MRKSLFCPNYWSSPKSLQRLLKVLCVTYIYTQPIRSYHKRANVDLLLNITTYTWNLSHSVGKLCLICKQVNIKLCSVIQLLPTIVQLSPYHKYKTFGILCKQTRFPSSHICTWHVNKCSLSKHWKTLKSSYSSISAIKLTSCNKSLASIMCWINN